MHRLARQARPRVRGAQHHQGPQAQVTLTPVVTDGVHRVLQLEVPGLRLLSMTSGDNTAGQRPACPSMLAQRPWTRRAVPSPTALLGLCLLAQRQDTCPVPCLQPAPPRPAGHTCTAMLAGPHVVGGAARCISANHWAFLKLGKWQVGREVQGLFCVKGHIVSISFLTESLATVGTRKGP